MNLEELAIKYGTDKLDHGYVPFYEKHLPKNPQRILEIGVKQGYSLAMWAEYFPDAEIHGLDLFQENHAYMVRDFLAEKNIPLQNVYLHHGNQCDWQLLEQLRKYDFDVIVDDGSHNSRDQMITFFGLFNGKHYFIEDLHCNDEVEFYGDGLPEWFCAKGVFGTMYAHEEEYGDGEQGEINFDKQTKIVCIHAPKLNQSAKEVQPTH